MHTWFKYTVQAFQKDLFWLPLALMGLFSLIAWMLPAEKQYDTARSFIGFLLPLIAGGFSAYAFLEDDALELQFSTQRPAWRMIVERLGIVAVVIAATSLIFQGIAALLGISLAPLGGFLQRQLVWLVPSLCMIVIGGVGALLSRSSSGGLAFIGSLWIIQLLLRGWFIRQRVWRNILLFYGVMDPLGNNRIANQLTLLGIAILLMVVIHNLLKKQERYI